MRQIAVVMLVIALTACGGSESAEEPPPAPPPEGGAPAASEVIREEVERIRAENEEPATPEVDPVMEERCAEVPQSEMDRVEAMMTQIDRETVMLTGADMLALGCSRYQQYLRGERSSY